MFVRPVSLIVSGVTLAASAPLLTERILQTLEALEALEAVRCLETTSHHAAVEIVLGHNGIIDLLSWYRLHHLQVIGLLNLAQLDIQFVALLQRGLASLVVGRLLLGGLANLVIDGTLLMVHLTEQREELVGLLLGELSLSSHKLLHISVKLLGREPRLLTLSTHRNCHQQLEDQDDDCLFHRSNNFL